MQRFTERTSSWSWLFPVVLVIVLCLLITGLSRIGLALWQWDRVQATGGLGFIMTQGLRFDLVSLGWLLGIPVAATPLALAIPAIRRIWPALLRLYFVLVIALLVFMELATPSFIAEYDTRPNNLFVDYLKYPREVFSMLWAAYKLPLLVTAIVMPVALIFANRLVRDAMENVRRTPLLSAIVLPPLVLFVAFVAIRSTLDHRPVNPSTVAFSSDPLVNTLALNSSYSVFYAIYERSYEDADFAYGDVDVDAVFKQIHASMDLPAAAFSNAQIPTLHRQQATHSYERPKNLVIVLEESLGAEFVGSLGGLPLTPNLDAWSGRGIWFERLYATGTRSVRGLEAIITGFWPSTSGSVVKLGKSQSDFFTLGDYLRRAGYDTSFLYGGEAQFDNMRRFFANNGFDTIVDKRDYEDPEFYGSWGVCDGDLFAMADQRFEAQPRDKPFFSLVFTSSNHSPFEFPDGHIELYEQPAATVNNAVKYADQALGDFLDRARKSSYWDDTIFLVVADHNSRVYGAELVPIERFHIPGLILGGGITPSRVTRIASQVDLLPTILSLAGVSGLHPAIGLDLTRPDIDRLPGRAVMQYGATQAYMENDQVVILRRDIAPEQFHYDAASGYTPVDNDALLIAKAMNLAAWPWLAYSERRYRLPGIEPVGLANTRISTPPVVAPAIH